MSKYLVFGLILLLLEVSAFNLIGIKKVNAIDAWINNNVASGHIIRVPIAWCAVTGSHAANSPNIPNPWGGSDTTTEDVLWRRHERVTENIFLDQAGITFRSALSNPFFNSFTFPIINDPEQSVRMIGDLNLFSSTEASEMINQCLLEWQNITKNKSGIFPGILGINVNLITNSSGEVLDIIGFGGCTDNDSDTFCDSPYDGFFLIIDNRYMIPGLSTNIDVTDTCPPPEDIWNKDPFDQALGHELGHTLGISSHRDISEVLALMNGCQIHEGPMGQVSNINLNDEEVEILRNNAENVPNPQIMELLFTSPAEFDKPKVFPGDIVRSIRVDDIKENERLNSFEDISIVKVTFDKKHNVVAYGIQFLGILPEKIKKSESGLQYWILVDSDNNQFTGGNITTIKNIEIPVNDFTGIDLVITMKFIKSQFMNNSNIVGTSWLISDSGNNITENIPVDPKLQTFTIHGLKSDIYSDLQKKPLYDTVNVIVNNSKNIIKLNHPFNVQVLVESNGTIVDSLSKVKNPPLILAEAIYPQCYIKELAIVGEKTIVNVSGLLPDSEIHALLGPRLITNSITDNFGNSSIEFQIPKDTLPGLHLITVGVDGTALTADCEILVKSKNNQ
ncbi:MAG: hypothetical protein ACPKPY_11495 [Nitrososphaeraceae archaeon]